MGSSGREDLSEEVHQIWDLNKDRKLCQNMGVENSRQKEHTRHVWVWNVGQHLSWAKGQETGDSTAQMCSKEHYFCDIVSSIPILSLPTPPKKDSTV